MTCEVRKDNIGQVTAILCGSSRRQTCKFCNHLWITKLCDFPVGHGKTCDAGMCEQCATNVAREVDYCPIHKGQTQA